MPDLDTALWVVTYDDGRDLMWWWTREGADTHFDEEAAKGAGRVRLLEVTPLPEPASEADTVAMLHASLPTLATTYPALRDTNGDADE